LDSIGPVVSEGKLYVFPFSIFSNVGHVGWSSDLQDTFLKGFIQGLSKQSLVPIDPVVSEMSFF